MGGGIRGALPQHLQLLRGVPQLVLEAPPAQACPQLLLFLGLVGGQLLKPDTQTHVHKTPSLLSLCKVRAAWEAAALFQGGRQRRPPAAPAPIGNVRRPGPLRCWKEEPAVHHLAACLGGSPGPGAHPALKRAGFPRGHFHSDPIQPFPALCLCTGWGRSQRLPLSPAPIFVKGCLLWSLLMQPRWFCLHITRHSAGLDALCGGRPAPALLSHQPLSLPYLLKGGQQNLHWGGTRPVPGLISGNIRSLRVHSTDIYRVTARPWGYYGHSPYPMESSGCRG